MRPVCIIFDVPNWDLPKRSSTKEGKGACAGSKTMAERGLDVGSRKERLPENTETRGSFGTDLDSVRNVSVIYSPLKRFSFRNKNTCEIVQLTVWFQIPEREDCGVIDQCASAYIYCLFAQ